MKLKIALIFWLLVQTGLGALSIYGKIWGLAFTCILCSIYTMFLIFKDYKPVREEK